MIALLLAAAWAEPMPTVLDAPRYAFCHDNVEDEFSQEFCPLLVDLPPDRCPGLRAFCDKPEEARPASGCDRVTGGSGSAGYGGTPDAPERRDLPSSGCAFDAPELGLGPLLGWVVAITVVAVIFLFFVVIARFLGLRTEEPEAPVVVLPEEEEPQDFATALQDVPDLPSRDLLDAARKALDDGAFGEAAVLARGASLQRLGEQGLLRLHRARTDREYLRKTEDPMRGDLTEVFEAAERHRWGGRPLTGEVVRSALDAAARILAIAGAMLLFVGVALASDRDGAAGDLALRTVLQDHGHDVVFRLSGFDAFDDDLDVLVLDTSGVTPTEEDWVSLRAWVEEGHVLVVAGEPVGFEELGTRTLVLDDGVLVDPVLESEGLVTPRWPGGPEFAFSGGEGWVTTGGLNAVAVARVGEGVVLAIADARLFWNGAFVDPVNEAFVGELLYRGQQRGWPMESPIRVELSTVTAAEDPDPAQSLANARLLPMVLQILVFWTVLGLYRGWPFAPLREPVASGRRAFSEHIAAVALRYRRMGATRHVASRFAALQWSRLGRAGLMLLARRSGRSAEEADQLVADVEELADTPDGPNSPEDLKRMEELWNLTRPR